MRNRLIKSSSSVRIDNDLSQMSRFPPKSAVHKAQITESHQMLFDKDRIIDEQFDQFETQSKLPQLFELINLKIRPQDKDLQKSVIDVVKYAQKLENTIKLKNKQIQKSEYIIKFLTIGQQKRDIMVQTIQEENRKLKEINHQLEKQIYKIEKEKIIDVGLRRQETKMLKRSETIQGMALQNHMKFQVPNRDQIDELESGLLTLEVQDLASVIANYKSLSHMSSLNTLLGVSVVQFEESIQLMNENQAKSIFNSLNQALQEHKLLFFLVAKLRSQIQMALQLSNENSLISSFEKVIQQCTDNLECDRSSVFVFDREKQQLWTKIVKGTNEIRIPFNQGIVGHVFTSGEHLNIMNAYGDHRFSKDADKASGYKTNTILCCPIQDPANPQNTLGVIECINKLSGYFTKDDERILSLICQIIGISVKKSLLFDESVVYHNSFRHLLQVNIKLAGLKTIENVLNTAEFQLKDLFNVEHCRIFVVDGEQMYRFEKGIKLENSTKLSILGDAIEKMKITNQFSPYTSQLYNKQVDLETRLPIYSFPVINQISNKVSVAIQIVNQRGIQQVSSSHVHKISSLDFEILNIFGQFLSQKLASIE